MTHDDTLADRRRHLEAGLTEITCDHCGALVRARKASPQQTSVQWIREAVRRCTEFAVQVPAGGCTALVPTCTGLRDSIDRAVRDGRLDSSP